MSLHVLAHEPEVMERALLQDRTQIKKTHPQTSDFLNYETYASRVEATWQMAFHQKAPLANIAIVSRKTYRHLYQRGVLKGSPDSVGTSIFPKESQTKSQKSKRPVVVIRHVMKDYDLITIFHELAHIQSQSAREELPVFDELMLAFYFYQIDEKTGLDILKYVSEDYFHNFKESPARSLAILALQKTKGLQAARNWLKDKSVQELNDLYRAYKDNIDAVFLLETLDGLKSELASVYQSTTKSNLAIDQMKKTIKGLIVQ